MKLLSSNITEIQKVSHYAAKLNVSSTYLNESTRIMLGVSAKRLIIEQLVMRTRHELKFTDKSVKEIAYELGFSSPDYFSFFCKKHTGFSPSEVRKV
jgi:AraC-like DNA-binding protein